MSIKDMLPVYTDSLRKIHARIRKLRIDRHVAERAYEWNKADEYSDRIIQLEDMAEYLESVIDEIASHK